MAFSGDRTRYRLTADWELAAAADRVFALLAAPLSYPSWWSAIRSVRETTTDPGRESGVFVCQGGFPYRLRFAAETVRVDPARRSLICTVSGDLNGQIGWQVDSRGDSSTVHLVQQVTVAGWLRPASYLFRPLLLWNHRTVLESCERGLRRLS